MIEILKPVESLTVADLAACPVWSYTNRDGPGETIVRSVLQLPVSDLTNKIIGTHINLANGASPWALIGNIDANNPRFTEHFLTLSIERDGRWFTLARYHDWDYTSRGPAALARFLDLPIDDVFPIAYDVSQYVLAKPAALAGTILKEPRERLSRDEIIAMAVL